MSSESIATALREGLTNELIRQKFARLLCGAAAMDAATTDEWREYISSALTPVVERLLLDNASEATLEWRQMVDELRQSEFDLKARAAEAERRLREIGEAAGKLADASIVVEVQDLLVQRPQEERPIQRWSDEDYAVTGREFWGIETARRIIREILEQR